MTSTTTAQTTQLYQMFIKATPEAIWEAISEARRTGVFEPSPGRQCDWCAFKAHCPAWGGTLLPMPAPPSRWARLRRSLRRRWRRWRRRARRPGAPP